MAALPDTGRITLAEILAALSHALDLTEGQPEGHCIRSCYIGLEIGREIGLAEPDLRDLYFAVLLKDLGCSSNAARICELYMADDIGFKRDFKSVNDSLPQVLRFVLSHTGLQAGLADRFRAIVNIFRNGGEIARELIETRCNRGADIARQMRFSEAVAAGIAGLDEHWDGGGKPYGLAGEAIPILSRLALLAQVIDVFAFGSGPEAATAEVVRRTGSWFDPALAAAFARVAGREAFWTGLMSPDLQRQVLDMEPGRLSVLLDEEYLDDIAAGFANVIDSKSPFTSGHSTRVAVFTDLIAEAMGFTPERRRWLRRAALLHDIGKLGVSNAILDKPGKLDDEEWAQMRMHSGHSEKILLRISAFAELAEVAGAHHERLDGKDYPKGLTADDISLETRIITTADIFDALTADRPYRAAMPVERALGILHSEVGTAVDPDCLAALEGALAGLDQPAAASPLREAA